METGLFDIQAQEMQAEYVRDYPLDPQLRSDSQEIIRIMFQGPRRGTEINGNGPAAAFASCFSRLANLPNLALDRLSRYETTLWRQVGRILFALDAMDRRKPQERRRHSMRPAPRLHSNMDLAKYLAGGSSLADDC
jgi:hypothetical protein